MNVDFFLEHLHVAASEFLQLYDFDCHTDVGPEHLYTLVNAAGEAFAKLFTAIVFKLSHTNFCLTQAASSAHIDFLACEGSWYTLATSHTKVVLGEITHWL